MLVPIPNAIPTQSVGNGWLTWQKVAYRRLGPCPASTYATLFKQYLAGPIYIEVGIPMKDVASQRTHSDWLTPIEACRSQMHTAGD